MKSDIYTEKHGMEPILAEAERIGAFCKLPPSASGKLRLLAEEMLSLTVRLFDDLKYEFFIENDGRVFTLHLSVNTLVSSEQKEKLISLSSRGENQATKGIFGKISGIFEGLLLGSGEYAEIAASCWDEVGMTPYWGGMGMTPYFSLAVYQNEMPKTAKKEEWDGLEKSIIATLAKDMIIGVKNKKVEMIALIEF